MLWIMFTFASVVPVPSSPEEFGGRPWMNWLMAEPVNAYIVFIVIFLIPE